jgi:NADPH:quinone reductase-like Zn-dependent oxidoreductase
MRWKRGIAVGCAGVVTIGLAALGIAYAVSDNDCDAVRAAKPAAPMKAFIYCDYGSSSVLRLAAIEKPVPSDSQVLVRVHAVSVNPVDWHYMRGEPYVMRLSAGLRKPKALRIGTDFAGVVEAVGKDVRQWKPGDEVFGARTGAFAEYVTLRASSVAAKPANATFEEAAAIPVSALTALQGLRDHGKVRRGQRVLINGASGGVGTFAVQIAKWLGAEVTGVASTRNVDLVRSLGADRVIDYTTEDFTRGAVKYDVIIDNVGNHPLPDLLKVLAPSGRYIMIGGPKGKWIAPFPRVIGMIMRSPFVDQEMKMFISKMNSDDLRTLAGLVASGKLRPTIDRRYGMAELAEAVTYQEQGRARAKVVVTMR